MRPQGILTKMYRENSLKPHGGGGIMGMFRLILSRKLPRIRSTGQWSSVFHVSSVGGGSGWQVYDVRSMSVSTEPAPGVYTLNELMVVAAAREIKDGEVVFVGMRLPLIAFVVAKKTHAPNAVGLFENGVIRSTPSPELIYTMADPPNIKGATQCLDMMGVMALLQSGRVHLGFLGAAEVDKYGNLNSTQVEGKNGVVRLPGSGGACDIASLAHRFVALLEHSRHRLPERVSYITSPGYGNGPGWRKTVGLPRGGPSVLRHPGPLP